MRPLAVVVFLSIQCASFGKPDRNLPENAAWTWGTFALLVGQYYVTHHTWPSTVDAVRADAFRFPDGRRSTQERAGLAKILASFTRVDFVRRGKDLLLITRFRSNGREYTYDAIFHPGRSAEDIVDARTPK